MPRAPVGLALEAACALTYLDCEQSHRYAELATGTDAPPTIAGIDKWEHEHSWTVGVFQADWHQHKHIIKQINAENYGGAQMPLQQ